MKTYKGKYIPFPPRKSWKWMTREDFCKAPASLMHEKGGRCRYALQGYNPCSDCIYASVNKEQRKAYYEKCFPQEKKQIKIEEEFPELTATAFHCPDCPKEAEILSVMPGGEVFAFDENVQYLATLELKCKFPGQVRREHTDFLPRMAKPSALKWNGKYKKIPSTDVYFERLTEDTVAILGRGSVVTMLPERSVDVLIEKLEPHELIGKVVKTDTDNGVRYDTIVGVTETGVIITGTYPDGMTQDTFIRRFRFLDDSMPFKPVH